MVTIPSVSVLKLKTEFEDEMFDAGLQALKFSNVKFGKVIE
jgi:hypothetical protein